jgi:transposase
VKPGQWHHLCPSCEHDRRYPPPPPEHKEPEPSPPAPIPLFDRSESALLPLTDEQRWALITLYRMGYHKQDIASEISCSEKTVNHWIAHYEEYRDVDDLPRSGRPPITDENTNITIVVHALVEKFTVPQLIEKELDLDVSPRTIRRRLDEAGLFGRVARKGPPLTAEHQQQRLSFAQGYHHMTVEDWKLVVFSDETHIHLGQRGQIWVQRPVGTAYDAEYIRPKTAHPPRISIWGMFTSRGVGDIHLFQENLDAKLMNHILNQHLIQSCNRVFSETEHWKFLWDNDPKHTSNKIKTWMHNHGVLLLEFPPYSPDLNPIENLWKNLKDRVGQRYARNIEDLQTYIEEE